ncbi:MAG: acyl-CoA dehydrogenase, partial [Gammaproteobacteria bacterium]|nr:acyl-CoA dehydrogenase [Gammaproteobacteria bacterium]
LGEENRGLAAMFKMMNLERLTVGIQGLGLADIAYQNAVNYALERRQSKAPAPRPDASKAADPIIYQPEIKRQLLTIRAQVEGARALMVFAGLHVDIMEKSADAAAAADARNLVALLTPVVKAFFTDLGMSSTLSAQQVYGGHGYVCEYGMEQLVRDARIGQIYEGTNEVQAVDLVARKLTGKTGEFADRFLADQQQFLAEHEGADDDAEFIAPVAEALERLVSTTAWVRDKLQNDDAAARGAATHYLRLFGLTIIACMWAQIMIAVRGKTGEFYDVKRKVARFYMQQVLPDTVALAEVITAGDAALGNFSVADFQD